MLIIVYTSVLTYNCALKNNNMLVNNKKYTIFCLPQNRSAAVSESKLA